MVKKKTETLNVIALRGVVLFPGTAEHFDIGRPMSMAALEDAVGEQKNLFAVCQLDPDTDAPKINELYSMGSVCEIKQVMPLPDGNLRVLVAVKCRGILKELADTGDMLVGKVELIDESSFDGEDAAPALRAAKNQYRRYLEAKGESAGPAAQALLALTDAGLFCDRLAQSVMDSFKNKQRILECADPEERAVSICAYLQSEINNIVLSREIQSKVQSSMDKNNREFFLREQQRVISEELGEDDESAGYEKKLASLEMNDEARERTLKEIKHLKRAAPMSPEAAVMENYIEYMLELPWGKRTKDKTDIARARKVLDEDHYGLEEVKKRILEFLAVRVLQPEGKSPIICLVGAPGVGKTSIARSIARALDRKFCQVSLGGVHDEAELRGHRRTYVAAMPGRVISAIKQCGSVNPVFLFDEIDKMASDMRGDPASAMLEILDPEQNSRFRDHYLEAPFDLSKVLFITTANNLEAIPKPLFDRMDVIEVSSYTLEEKTQIAKRHLWKKQLAENGMKAADIKITDEGIRHIIESYTMEAGVRSLERTLGRVIRKAAVKKLELGDEYKCVRITPASAGDFLGAPRFIKNTDTKQPEVGVVNGLAWTSVGGAVMPIEVAVMPGSGKLELTGNLGDVMKESARIALSFVRRNMEKDGVTEEQREKTDIHIHVPEGATPKDGPSAGVAMACALYSALTGIPARRDTAMTGEISLRGKALPIGGLKEKLLAAYRAGITNALIPKENLKDLEEIPADILEKLNIIPMTEAVEALRYILPGTKV